MYFSTNQSSKDFIEIVKANRHRFPSGVVNEYDCKFEELKQLIDLDLYVGVTGCYLNTEDLCNMIKEIPLNRLLIESHSPWCSIQKRIK
jgi:TatD DNase family protein